MIRPIGMTSMYHWPVKNWMKETNRKSEEYNEKSIEYMLKSGLRSSKFKDSNWNNKMLNNRTRFSFLQKWTRNKTYNKNTSLQVHYFNIKTLTLKAQGVHNSTKVHIISFFMFAINFLRKQLQYHKLSITFAWLTLENCFN